MTLRTHVFWMISVITMRVMVNPSAPIMFLATSCVRGLILVVFMISIWRALVSFSPAQPATKCARIASNCVQKSWIWAVE